MPTTQVDDGLDEFVKNYRAKNPNGTDDDLDAFVKNFKSAPNTLPASFTGFDADRAAQTPDTLPKDFDGFDTDGPGQTVAAPKTPAPAQPVSTIGPSTHTVLDSVRRMFGAGAPQGSVMANAMDQTGTKDNLRLLAPEQLMTESQQQRHPIATGVGEVAGGLTSPDSLMLLAGTAGAGQLAGPAGQTVKQLLAAGFTAQMLTSAMQQVPEVAKAIQSGDSYNAKRLMTHLALTTAMAGGAAHGVFDEPKPLTVPKDTISAPLDRDFSEQPQASANAATGQAQPAADDLDSFVAQYKNSPAPQNPLAGKPAPAGHIGPLAEPLAPEHPDTLRAQTTALANGTNGVVYFPKGTETIPAPPENASVTVVPGDKAGAGTYYHTPDVTPEQIQSSVADGTFGKLLGNQQTKEEAIAGQAPAAIVARDENGTEIKASLVDSADPHVAAAQAATFQRQFPDAQITVESPDDVVADRLKSSTGAITPQVDMPEYYRHPVTGENVRITPDELDSGALALYGKENYRDLTPSQKQNLIKFATPKTKGLSIAAQSVAGDEKTSQPALSEQTPASYAQSLHDTAAQVELYNAPIAHALRSIAQGEPQSMSELRQFVANFIDDPKEKAKLSQILDSDNQNVRSSGSLPDSLHETADQVERHNAPVADALRSIANGEPQSRGELQRFVENFIDDPKARADLSRILDADNQKASAGQTTGEHPLDRFVREYQPTQSLADHAAALRDLSVEIENRDPQLSQSLKQLATGNPRALESFRQYVDANVTDGPQSKEFFRLIDAAEAEARRSRPSIGDQIDVSGTGRLKGKRAEVTQTTDSGVYARELGAKRISFVPHEEFERASEASSSAGHGPGTPLADHFDNSGTRIEQLAKTIRENSSNSKPIEARIDIAERAAQRANLAKDATSRALGSVKAVASAMFDAYRRPAPWTEFDDALGKYQGALQRSAHDLREFAGSLRATVPDKLRREAITNWVEAAGDKSKLREWAEASKGSAKKGYEAALTLNDAERTIARNMQLAQDERFQLDRDAGLLEHEVENYVMHAWKKENPYTKELVSNVRAGMLKQDPAFTKARVFGTYFDGEQAGYAPVDKDAGFLFAAREHSGNEAIAARAFMRSLLEGRAQDGRPLATPSGAGRTFEGTPKNTIERGAPPEETSDYRAIDHPALRNWVWDADGNKQFVRGNILVHPEAYSKLKNILSRSALRQLTFPGTGVRPLDAALRLSSEFKNTLLSFSGFHQTQEGLHAIFHKVNPFTTKPVDFTDPLQMKLIDHGLQVASFDAQEQFGEGLTSGLSQRIPIVGKLLHRYNDYLFSDLIPRLKMTLAQEALRRNTARYSEKLSEDQIYRQTADQANAAFGELNYTMMGRNKTFQDVLRMALLAPDFLEARGRFVGQALKPFGREQAYAIIRGALGMYVAARVLNQMTDDDPHWKPEDAFTVVYKGRAYALRSVPADIAHLFTDPRGFIYNRLNPLYGKGTIEAITGRDQYGRKKSAVDQLKDLAHGALPIPFQGAVKEPDAGGLTSTALSSLGLSTTPYLTPATRLARQMVLDNIPSGEQNEERMAENRTARKYEDDLRNKRITPADLAKARSEGKITAADQKRIVTRAARTPLQNYFKNLTPEQALQVWDKADPQERSAIRPLLVGKLENAQSLPPDVRARMRGALRSTVGVPRTAPGVNRSAN